MSNQTNVEIVEETFKTDEELQQEKLETKLNDLFASLDEVFIAAGYMKIDEDSGLSTFTPSILYDLQLYSLKFTRDFVNGHMATLAQIRNLQSKKI